MGLTVTESAAVNGTFDPVGTADDADQVAYSRGWYFRGGKAICPRHVMEGGR